MSRHGRRRPRPRDDPDEAPFADPRPEMRAEVAAIRRVVRRFDHAIAADPASAGAADDAAVLRRLRDEPVAAMSRVVYSSNAVFLIELAGPDPIHPEQPLRAIYKPARGERPLWDFPRQTLHMREAAAYSVSAALGDGLVPPTTLRDGPHGPGSVQIFVHPARDDLTAPPATLEEELRGLAALDVVINNADRKRAHLLLDEDGRLHGIDNALSFLPYPRQRTVLIELGGERLPAAVARRVSALAADPVRRAALDTELTRLLEREEVVAFGERLDRLAHEQVYPRLDPWDGRPFEWW